MPEHFSGRANSVEFQSKRSCCADKRWNAHDLSQLRLSNTGAMDW